MRHHQPLIFLRTKFFKQATSASIKYCRLARTSSTKIRQRFGKHPVDSSPGEIFSYHEGATKANLGLLRSASTIYYSDTEGNYPAKLDALLTPGQQRTPRR